MHDRINGDLRKLAQVVRDNPELQGIIDKDPKAEINPRLHDHIKDPAFLLGCDLLRLQRRTAKIVEGKKYDVVKIRRRVEERLRKYATDQVIVALALFFGVPIT